MYTRVGVNMRYLGAVGWQPTALSDNNRVNIRYLGTVGWEVTAQLSNNVSYEHQGWGQHEVFWGCRLATYSIYWQQCGL